MPPLFSLFQSPPAPPPLKAPIAINITLATMALTIVILRLWVRMRLLRWPGWDDVWIVTAMLGCLAYTTSTSIGFMRYGWGHAYTKIPLIFVENLVFVYWLSLQLYFFSVTTIRISIFVFYHRLLSRTNDSLSRIIYGSIAVMVIQCIIYLFITIFICTPVNAMWKFPPPEGSHCLPKTPGLLAHGYVNAAFDFYTTLLPLFYLSRLRMQRKKKIGVGIVFSLGFIISLSGLARVLYIHLTLGHDRGLVLTLPVVLVQVELAGGIMCASAPAINCLFHSKSQARSLIQKYWSFKVQWPRQASIQSTTLKQSDASSELEKGRGEIQVVTSVSVQETERKAEQACKNMEPREHDTRMISTQRLVGSGLTIASLTPGFLSPSLPNPTYYDETDDVDRSTNPSSTEISEEIQPPSSQQPDIDRNNSVTRQSSVRFQFTLPSSNHQNHITATPEILPQQRKYERSSPIERGRNAGDSSVRNSGIFSFLTTYKKRMG